MSPPHGSALLGDRNRKRMIGARNRKRMMGALAVAAISLACDDKPNKALPANDPDAASLTPALSMPSAKPSSEPTIVAAMPDAGGDGGLGCGSPPLPECPLFSWMKTHAKPAMNKEDALLLSEAFEKMATFAPQGFPNWASISKDGERAAKSGSMDGARAACRECHDQYKKKYKTEVRGRALP